MSKLINPRNGLPMGTNNPQQPPAINMQQLLGVLTSHDHKIDMLNGMHMQLAFWVEYVVEKLMTIEGPDGNPLFVMDVEEFQAFAEKRFEEIQQEAATKRTAQENEQAAELLASVQEVYEGSSEINLDE